MIRTSMIAALMLGLAACAQPQGVTIDGTNAATYAETMKAVREPLSATDRVKFEAALKVIEAQVFAKATSPEEYGTLLRAELDGKTAADVIAQAGSLTDDIQQKAADAVFDAKNVIAEEAGKLKEEATGAAMGAARDAAKELVAPPKE
jgi:hypothetical protein